MKYILTATIILTSFSLSSAQDNFCGIHNTAFLAGEDITYEVFYNLGKLYVGAGQAEFTTNLEKINNEEVYHITGVGKTFKSYDWFYKVRDTYESYIDTASMLPVKFIRNVNEGGYRLYNNVTFNQQEGIAVSTNGVFKVPGCVQDVLSAIYYARNIDYDKYKPGDKIPFNMFLDDKVYNIYIRYMGKEMVTTQFGTFNAIRIKPFLISGTIFKGGEEMNVWVSDDKNHIPLRIDSPIAVGSIKVDMIAYKNIRYPFTSLISRDK
jgi:Protein of unknown function (DUF3108)